MADMAALPHLIPAGCLALLLVAGSILFFRKRLVSGLRPPSAPVRLLVPFALSVVAFILMQAQTGLELHNPAPELYSDGLFSLFGGIFAFTAVPDLKPIFALPCIWLALGMGVILLLRLCLMQYGGARGASLLGAPARLWDALCARYGRFQVQLICLLLFVMLVRLCSLGLYPLMDTTEARYGEMARKMMETGNWLQPQFDYGIPFWGKPPLSFQASAATMSLLGLTPFAARLAPFLTCVCMGLLFYAWFPREERWEKGSACFIIFFTCAVGFVAAGAVMTDAYLALGIMLALVSFHCVAHVPSGGKWWGYLFFVGLAVGLMSKGPLTLVLCAPPLLPARVSRLGTGCHRPSPLPLPQKEGLTLCRPSPGRTPRLPRAPRLSDASSRRGLRVSTTFRRKKAHRNNEPSAPFLPPFRLHSPLEDAPGGVHRSFTPSA